LLETYEARPNNTYQTAFGILSNAVGGCKRENCPTRSEPEGRV
jgi:hypothetical protein